MKIPSALQYDPGEPLLHSRRRSQAIGARLRQMWDPKTGELQPRDLLDILARLDPDPWTQAEEQDGAASGPEAA